MTAAGARPDMVPGLHAGAVLGYFSGWVTGGALLLAGIVVFTAYLLIAALSVAAFIELAAGAVILAASEG